MINLLNNLRRFDPRKLPGLPVLLPVIVLCLLFSVFGEVAIDIFAFNRNAIGEGEYYRLLTCHFVHLNPKHLLVNLLGLCLLFAIPGRQINTRSWLLAITGCCILLSFALFWGAPQVSRYVGLSGVLHGLFVVVVLRTQTFPPALKLILLIALAIKLFFDFSPQSLVSTATYIGGRISPESHLYGAVAGIMSSLFISNASNNGHTSKQTSGTKRV